jgi:predicted MPP superfamily phosphohydrolase
MSKCLADLALTHEMEPRLSRRRFIEARNHRRVAAGGHDGSNSLRDRVASSLLKTGLRMAGLYGRGVANALCPVVRHLRLEFANLPPGLDGFRILHLSDFHIDGMDGLAEIVAKQLAFLPVDLCVLTGDYRYKTGGPCDAIYPRMRRILGAIRARHGVVGILGNHDCADIAIELEKLNVRMLLNEAVRVGAPDACLWVIGVDDPHFYGCDDLAGAIEAVPPRGFKLLAAHSPEMFRDAAGTGVDLYLAGHTHAGQIRLPLIGGLTMNARCPRAYTHGHWRHGLMQGYTTAGVGCSLLPIRFGCPPEITVLELAKKLSAS